jgi:quinol monooxygenase YgiN
MFMRLLQIKISSEYIDAFSRFYDNVVLPELQKMDGCLFASLIQSTPQPEEFISITLWETKIEAESYEKSGHFKKLLEKIKPFIADSDELEINLSESLELEYKSESDVPIVTEYAVTAHKEDYGSSIEENPEMYVRLFKVKIQDEMLDECRNIYNKEIFPILREIKGCRCAYLVEDIQNPYQGISLTIWDCKKDADDYEKSGLFKELVSKVEHTFLPLYQWKLALEKNISGKIRTTQDAKLEQYNMIKGKRFI